MKKIIKYIFLFSILVIGIKSIAQETQLPEFLNFEQFLKVDYISAPAISFDAHYFAFVVNDNDTSRIYETEYINGKWQKPTEIKQLTKLFGTKKLNSPAYNYDGRTLYFSAQNGLYTDIFYIKRTENGWAEPQTLPVNKINTLYDEGEPSISANDNILYFVRFENQKDSECGRIYYSQRDRDGNWTEAKPLTDPLNKGCERTPRILSDNNTLLFSSKRDKNKKFMIYHTSRLYGDFWLLPKQLSNDVKDDQLYPCVSQIADVIYYSSLQNNRKATIVLDSLPNWAVPQKSINLTGKVTNENNEPILANILLRNPASMEIIGRYKNHLPQGDYNIFLPKDGHIVVDYNAENYSHFFFEIDTNFNSFKQNINAKLFDSVKLKLNVYDKDIYEPLNVDIKVFDKTTGDSIATKIQKVIKGKYQLTLPIGKKIIIKFTGFYIKDTDLEIDLSGIVLFDNFEKNVEIETEKTPYTYIVLDKQTQAGVSCTITLVDKKTNKRIVTTATTDENGKVTIYLKKGGVYDISINPQGYAFYSEQLDLNTSQETTKKVELQPLKKDVTLNIPNINFEINSSELKVESYKELDKVIELMRKNPQIKVEISAHTDDLGSEKYNMLLSEKRAKSVVDYMILNDLPANRIIAKGYGETKPIVPNTSEENRALNRRVELKIIEVNE